MTQETFTNLSAKLSQQLSRFTKTRTPEERLEHILRKLVTFRTMPENFKANHDAIEYIARFVKKRGMHVARYSFEGHEALVATLQPGLKNPKIMLAAHVDVVSAPDELFTLREEGNKLFGRGTLDMKSAIAVFLQIIDELGDDRTAYDFGLMITTEEEIGGTLGTAKLVEEGYRPQVVILPDGGENWQLHLSSKGVLNIILRAEGKSAHGSRPWEGKNAVDSILDALHDIRPLFANQNIQTRSFNIGTIHGGNTANQVPDHAEAALDIRFTSQEERHKLLNELQTVCKKHGVDMQIEVDAAITNFSLQNPFLAAFARLITKTTGTEIRGSHTLGTSDARFFAAHGIPCISYYPPGAGHHSNNEWIDRTAFHQSKIIIRAYLDEIGRVKS